MSGNYFNPSTANDLARFQGTFAGIQAGNAYYTGVATAPTSIYNQAGYHAFSNGDGTVSLKKDAQSSTFTGSWYDQTTGVNFNFSNALNGTTSNTSSASNSTSNSGASNSSSTTNNSSTTATTSTYPWGAGYVVTNNNNNNNSNTNSTSSSSNKSTTTTTSNGKQKVDENGDPIKLSAKDLQDLVDSGAYDNLQEALEDVKADGYTVDDKEQAKLGIYTDESEKTISSMMKKLGISRDEAIAKLGDKLDTNEGMSTKSEDEYYQAYDNLINQGLSDEEAQKALKKLGYDTPQSIKDMNEVAEYKEQDQAKILSLVQSTGCTVEEAANSLGVKKDSHGIIRSIGDFFGNIGKGISDAWNGFMDWLW